MSFERTIKLAFDKKSETIIDAEVVFGNAKDGHDFRNRYHKNEFELSCCECGQTLTVSSSVNNRVHFKHQQNSNFCILKDRDWNTEEIQEIAHFHNLQESERHKKLKNQIATKLSNITGVKDIFVDDKFIFDTTGTDEKRKPDVFCTFNGRKLVFEIQLSNLPYRYILARHEFYKRNGIYLIWILDNFDIKNQRQMEKDIKYLNKYENFFKLDEISDYFKLRCQFKRPYLTAENELHTKWDVESVKIQQLQFDKEEYQVFYFDFDKNKAKKEQEKTELEFKKKIEASKLKSLEIKTRLNSLYNSSSLSFDAVREQITKLNDFELLHLNNELGFIVGEPKIHKIIKTSKDKNFSFLKFLLQTLDFNLDVNVLSERNESLFMVLANNQNISRGRKQVIARLILERNYYFLDSDEKGMESVFDERKFIKENIVIYKLARELLNSNMELLDTLFKNSKLVCTIESAKRNEIVGFGYKKDEWLAFANNAVSSYPAYWYLISTAFEYHGIFAKLRLLDKKGTFQKKVSNIDITAPKDYQTAELLKVLYPEFH